MEVVISRSFLKDLRTKPRAVVTAVDQLISLLEASASLETSGTDFKKLEGQKRGEHYYRIMLWEWRIGVAYIHPKIIILRILARAEACKHFPPPVV